MRVLIAHNEVAPGAPPHENDVLVQAQAVATSLRRLGHETRTLGVGLDLSVLRRAIESMQPEVVFNLVESLDGADRLIAVVPLLLESLGVPYTGVSAGALLDTSDKVKAKELLAVHGIRAPRTAMVWPPERGAVSAGDEGAGEGVPPSGRVGYTTIVKSRHEHGSLALDDEMVQPPNTQLPPVLERLAPRLGGACLAEEFVAGRELNLSLISAELLRDAEAATALAAALPGSVLDAAFAGAPICLPPAEIQFSAFPSGKPRIVGYDAKWNDGSFESIHTPRSFDFAPSDARLLGRLRQEAVRVWQVLALRGFARVDFRVDAKGTIFVLEVNANPCLSPDAGFAAALERTGVSFDAAIAALLRDATAEPIAARPRLAKARGGAIA